MFNYEGMETKGRPQVASSRFQLKVGGRGEKET